MPTIDDLEHLTSPQQQLLIALNKNVSLCSQFYWIGGTLLKAIGIVPRESNDLDFFSVPTVDRQTFNPLVSELRKVAADVFGSDNLSDTERGFQHTDSGMLIDVILDTTPTIAPFVRYDNVQTADIKDITANKASALCCRDELKDLIDIAFLTKYMQWSLVDLSNLAEQKFRMGSITEEKLFTEIASKKEMFAISPEIFLSDGLKNLQLVTEQIDYLLQKSS